MQSTRKLFATFNNHSYRSCGTVEVQDEQQAVQEALKLHAASFTTYERDAVVIGGKELQGEPENFSPQRYINVGKLYTRDEVIAEIQKSPVVSLMGDSAEDRRMMRSIIKSVTAAYMKHPADALYFSVGRDDFHHLEAGEKVFDQAGKQLWPKAATAAPKP